MTKFNTDTNFSVHCFTLTSNSKKGATPTYEWNLKFSDAFRTWKYTFWPVLFFKSSDFCFSVYFRHSLESFLSLLRYMSPVTPTFARNGPQIVEARLAIQGKCAVAVYCRSSRTDCQYLGAMVVRYRSPRLIFIKAQAL